MENTQQKQCGTNIAFKKSIAERAFEYFDEYCEYTSIHGVKYLKEKRSLFER